MGHGAADRPQGRHQSNAMADKNVYKLHYFNRKVRIQFLFNREE